MMVFCKGIEKTKRKRETWLDSDYYCYRVDSKLTAGPILLALGGILIRHLLLGRKYKHKATES